MLLREPEDRGQLVELLHGAFENNLLDAEALSMIEGVMQVSEMHARDVMIPRSQMDMIDVEESPAAFIPFVIETAHSRFPVYENGKDNVIGILLAKDLLRYYANAEEFDVRDMLRPAVFAPESKRLNILLRDFKANRNHIAMVVDESGRFRVKAVTEIADFNEAFDTKFSDEDFDTVGGLVINRFGRVPKRGESVTFDGFKFAVLRADSRKVHSLLIERLGASVPGTEETDADKKVA